MKVLITGGSGLLGQYVNITLSEEHNILTLYNSSRGNTDSFNSAKTNLNDLSALKKIFTDFRPDVVIHLAGIASVKNAVEGGSESVYNINVGVTATIAALCEHFGARLIFTSTDLVYAGYTGSYLDEYAPKDPKSFYAETKLKAEEEIKKYCGNFVILRTALLYGKGLSGNPNHFYNTYQKFLNGEKADLFYDQYRTPLELSDAARIINLITGDIDIKGVVNFGGKERVTRVEMAEILCEVTGLDKSLINKVSYRDIPDLPDVKDVSLDISILKNAGIIPRSVEESISNMVNTKTKT